MRIIHTADWHLCDRLGRQNRTEDLKRRVERVADYCLSEQADVLVIAGDLFSEQASVDDMTDAFQHLHRVFKPFFTGGGTILAITGNHDRDSRINFARSGMLLAAPIQSGSLLPSGRMYLLNGCGVPVLQSKTGTKVQFVCVPYPFPSRYNADASKLKSREEENRFLRGEVAQWLNRKAEGIDPSLPTVLVAHLHVCGSDVHSLYKITEADDIQFQFADLQPHWAYVALGHIHKPQTLGGAEHVRYPGSLDQLDFGDTHGDYGVMVVDIQQDGTRSRLDRLKLEPTPFATIVLDDPEQDLPELPSKFPRHLETIARFQVNPIGNLSQDEIARQLKRLFPRWHSIDWLHSAPLSDDGVQTPESKYSSRNGLLVTVRQYLADKLKSDPDRDAVLALAETFLAPEKSS